MTAAGGWRPDELVYCSNVHASDDLDAILHTLRDRIAAVGRARGLPHSATGLWLNHTVAAQLDADPGALARFRAALDESGVRLFTLNGFPYGDFHAPAVKAAVYRPDWAEPARKDYSLQLARILTACLPAEQDEGSISTLPLGFQPDWNPARQEAALRQLCEVAAALAELETGSGRHIRLCLEMEPGCVLEHTHQVLDLFGAQLPAAADRHGVPRDLLARHLGICYDICHQAVMFEDIPASLGALHAAGVTIGKIQVSSALEAGAPRADKTRALLAGFAEPRYLHQVRSRNADGQLQGSMDLPDALADSGFPSDPWRIHFHVPVQSRTLFTGELDTTQSAIGAALDFLAAHEGHLHPHLEVETYTWQVLPEALRPRDGAQLISGLAQELHWLQEQLAVRGLLR